MDVSPENYLKNYVNERLAGLIPDVFSGEASDLLKKEGVPKGIFSLQEKEIDA